MASSSRDCHLFFPWFEIPTESSLGFLRKRCGEGGESCFQNASIFSLLNDSLSDIEFYYFLLTNYDKFIVLSKNHNSRSLSVFIINSQAKIKDHYNCEPYGNTINLTI